MRPTLLIAAMSTGMRGANRTLIELLDTAFCAAYQCVVAVPPEHGPFLEAMQRSPARLVTCDQPYWVTGNDDNHWLYCMRRLPFAVAEMRRIIRAEKVDLVFSNSGQSPFAAMAAALETRPHVWNVTECLLNPSTGLSCPMGHDVLARTVGGLSNAVIVPSRAVATEYAPYVEGSRLTLIPHGVALREFNKRVSPVNNARILSIGTTSESKGLDDLIEAASLMKRSGVTFYLDILGSFDSRSYEKKVMLAIRARGLTDRIHFHGWQENIGDWLDNSSILCSPSHAESFGRTIVEGMAAGRPVVATRCGGPEDIVLDMQTGRIVAPRAPNALAEALAALLDDTAAAMKMGLAGRQVAFEHFSLEVASRNYIDVMRKSLSEGPLPGARSGPLELLMAFIERCAPRILLGKKYWLLEQFRRFLPS